MITEILDTDYSNENISIPMKKFDTMNALAATVSASLEHALETGLPDMVMECGEALKNSIPSGDVAGDRKMQLDMTTDIAIGAQYVRASIADEPKAKWDAFDGFLDILLETAKVSKELVFRIMRLASPRINAFAGNLRERLRDSIKKGISSLSPKIVPIAASMLLFMAQTDATPVFAYDTLSDYFSKAASTFVTSVENRVFDKVALSERTDRLVRTGSPLFESEKREIETGKLREQLNAAAQYVYDALPRNEKVQYMNYGKVHGKQAAIQLFRQKYESDIKERWKSMFGSDIVHDSPRTDIGSEEYQEGMNRAAQSIYKELGAAGQLPYKQYAVKHGEDAAIKRFVGEHKLEIQKRWNEMYGASQGQSISDPTKFFTYAASKALEEKQVVKGLVLTYINTLRKERESLGISSGTSVKIKNLPATQKFIRNVCEQKCNMGEFLQKHRNDSDVVRLAQLSGIDMKNLLDTTVSFSNSIEFSRER